jgi:CRISPR/Cas system CSM-associated protein Csm4 (group 5 of RAMP superfamily)
MSHFDFYYQDILVATGGARLVTLKTVAQLLGRPMQTIYNSINQNKFEIPVKKIGKYSFITAADLAEFMSGSAPPKFSKNEVVMNQVTPEIDALQSFIGIRKRGRPRKGTMDAGGTR